MVVVVADRSRSMPSGSDAAHKELVDLLQSSMPEGGRVAVVSFGEGAAVEHAAEGGAFPGFLHELGGDGSSLAEGIDTALSLVPKDSPGRILVLSDGRWTGRDPAALAGLAADRGIAIDYRHRGRSGAGDLAVPLVDAPSAAARGEGFLITAWVRSPVEQDARFELTHGATVIASGNKRLTSGANRLTFRDRAEAAGSQGYQLRVTGVGDDPVPENNAARFLVGITGPRPILHITPGTTSGLTALLQKGGLAVRAVPADRVDLSLEALSGYSAVLVENAPAEKLGTRGMETLAAWVRASGSGLMLSGGQHSYGPGGYYKSPLEPILPVSMELRQEHRKFALAIVVALDRSGSMTMPVAGGKVKMDLANLGAAQVLDMLGPMDEFACLAVDTLAHGVVELGPATDKAKMRDKILRIQSEGGGIYVYQALAAAADAIQHAKAGTRHIILFADAADAEEPGLYKELLEKTRKAGITVSVIGLGTAKDKDAAFLEDVAKRGGGRLFITDKPDELPRLFAQDTFVVARNAFVDEPVRVQGTPGLAALTGRPFALDRSLGGYNLCYLRPEASLGAFTRDEYAAPAVASWQAGAGRVLCFTGEADGKYAGDFARSPEIGDFYTSLARWTAGQTGGLTHGMAVTQEVRNGINRIRLHLDPDRGSEPFAGTPVVRSLRARPGQSPALEDLRMTWAGPDTLVAEVALFGEETALSTVLVAGQKPQSLAPVCLPYSPEFAPPRSGESDSGRISLEKLARGTGGMERLELAGLWKDLPRRPRRIALAPWLLLAAALVLLLEVLERRTAFISPMAVRLRSTVGRIPTRASKSMPVAAKAAPIAARSPTIPTPASTAPVEATKSESVLDAMRQARERSRNRTEKYPRE
jgi:hypothetical protein